MKVFAFGLVIFIIIVFVFLMMVYNKLVRARNQAKNAFSQIDVQLKRRHDLIPNLVETAKRYLNHEEQTLVQVISARNQAVQMQAANDHNPESLQHMSMFAQAEGMLSKALGNLNAVIEDYPELKGDKVIMEVMEELQNTENRIGFARQHFNDSVMFYNNDREVFPNNLISGTFGFRPMAQLEFADKSNIMEAPNVNFSRS